VFKASTGIAFTDYLARGRVNRAEYLLQNPHFRVSDIAFDTHFESISRFNPSLERILGYLTPQFREV
jgi:methylphosphotriester-DNA--protein-cysteine methyltransferase